MPRKPARKKSVSEIREDKRLKAAVTVFAETGDERCAAKLLGRTLNSAYRALCHPDGITALEKLCSQDKGAYWSLDRAQRKALLSMAAVGGVLPEVQFYVDEQGNHRSHEQLGYVKIPGAHRAKFIELLMRMEGDLMDRHEHKVISGTHDDWVAKFAAMKDITPDGDVDPLS